MKTNVQSLYNQWANTYDDIENKTRDLDKIATQAKLTAIINTASTILEFGCGTGKNTEWLLTKTQNVIAADFSEEMLGRAREKLKHPNLIFRQADITQEWPFDNQFFNLITCNLILEHVEDLNVVFSEALRTLKPGGHFFISELHPAKQYFGSKARFELNRQIVSPDCFTHHISDYFSAASNNGFGFMDLDEWFDDNDRAVTPRLISFLFKKT